MSCSKPRIFLKKLCWATGSGPPQNSPMKQRVFAVHFLRKTETGQAYGKKSQTEEPVTRIWRRQFSPEKNGECF